MRHYYDLNADEKAKAFNKGLEAIIKVISESGDMLFPELSEHIEEAQEKAEKMQTPWFFGSILYQDVDGARELIDEAIQDYIERALYPEDGEYVINL